MASSLEHYLDQVERGLVSKNGDILAELFSFHHPHVASSRLRLPDAQVECEKWFEQPYDEMTAAHLRAVWAVANADYVEARAAQSVAVQYPFINKLTVKHNVLLHKGDEYFLDNALSTYCMTSLQNVTLHNPRGAVTL
ncbi:PCI domain-containing protein 2-like [Montipora capricornis]|uniref:PCI domain-containing protein 2-like n=1 Tax=Montipora capricornis TaxID=246305 RepID=UPI0035F13C6F